MKTFLKTVACALAYVVFAVLATVLLAAGLAGVDAMPAVAFLCFLGAGGTFATMFRVVDRLTGRVRIDTARKASRPYPSS